ncbi:hypothetical protein LXA43DRAFT_1099907 [Ganoderma leucocontextum]|nr:hypothetical protein LXA43DRAFT_1099907 [Ganoderma leucocontextum]
MAASNVTNPTPVYARLVDDSSPLLLFEPAGAWNHTAGHGTNLYVNSTYSSTDVSGATCKFSFNGTGFWVTGAKKANYGQYLILLDDEVQQFSNATAPQTLFGQVLGGASGLADGLHTVVFMAAGEGPVDVDAIVFETTDKQQSGTSSGIQMAPTPSPSSSQTGNRISANPHTQGPNESASSQSTSATRPSSNRSATPSTSPKPSPTVSSSSATRPSSSRSATPSTSPKPSPTVSSSSATAPLNGRLSSQASAQPSGQDTTAAHTESDAQVRGQSTAQSNAQPTAQPSSSEPTRSSTSSALGPSISQAEQANSPQIAGTSHVQKGLPLGAIIGISIGAAVALLLLIALLFCLMRRRRRAATARRRMTAGLPSPILPLQDPARHMSYYFGAYSNSQNAGPSGGNAMRELYLNAGPLPPSQSSFGSGVTMQGHATPYQKDADMVKPMAPAVLRDSVYSNADTATLASEDGYMTEASFKTIPVRPPRPPEVRLSVV